MNHPRPYYNRAYIIFAAAVTAIGGFLFGYDTAVINGANTFLQHHFHLDPKADSWWIGLATASAILGCIPGSMVSGFISDRYGRRRVLFLCALLFGVSSVLSAIPPNFGFFIASRLIGGIGIGIASMACPVYLAEISPPTWRGRLGTMFQLGIVAGIFLTLFINGHIQSLGDTTWNTDYGWRWMLGVGVVPAILFLVLLVPIPESPRWLIGAGREEEARKILHRIGGSIHADEEVAAVKEVLQQEEGRFSELFTRRYRIPLLIAFVLMVGSQFSGINAIMYYSTSIFLDASGIGKTSTKVTELREGLKGAEEAADLTIGQQKAAIVLTALRSHELQPILEKAGLAISLVTTLEPATKATDLPSLAMAARSTRTLVDGSQALNHELDSIETIANQKAFSCSVWLGFVNLLATGIAILLVDKTGRKPLLLVGNAVQVVALALIGWLFHTGANSTQLLLAAIILYLIAFAMAMGPLGWVVCSEIFPAKLRGRAMSVATFFIWTACNVVALTFPVLLHDFGAMRTFGFFAICSLATFIAVLLLLPETKGRTLEEIENAWNRQDQPAASKAEISVAPVMNHEEE